MIKRLYFTELIANRELTKMLDEEVYFHTLILNRFVFVNITYFS